MKIAVIGSRTFKDFSYLEETLHVLILEENEGNFEDVSIISGGAGGADKLGKQYAMGHNLNYIEYPAKWNDVSHPDARIKVNKYGKEYDANAGFRRNTQIIEDADIVVAFHNGSPGTADSLRKAKKLGKKVYEFEF